MEDLDRKEAILAELSGVYPVDKPNLNATWSHLIRTNMVMVENRGGSILTAKQPFRLSYEGEVFFIAQKGTGITLPRLMALLRSHNLRNLWKQLPE